MDYSNFLETVWNHYEKHGRHKLPWRSDTSMYAITVSELMLQQTQVNRVIPKFNEFMARFGSFETLARAPQADVIKVWQGLGYNRRARFLHQAAKYITSEWQGIIPRNQQALTELPGVGWNTAGAICAYSFNLPVLFIETNIRAVFLHHFFETEIEVSDKRLLPHVAAALDQQNPREFYWALMDYGSHLKKTTANPSVRSTQYKKQTKFEGSFRQVRAQILKQLIDRPRAQAELQNASPDFRIEQALESLRTDKLIHKKNGRFYI